VTGAAARKRSWGPKKETSYAQKNSLKGTIIAELKKKQRRCKRNKGGEPEKGIAVTQQKSRGRAHGQKSNLKGRKRVKPRRWAKDKGSYQLRKRLRGRKGTIPK